jgi:hypothetical protein
VHAAPDAGLDLDVGQPTSAAKVADGNFGAKAEGA